MSICSKCDICGRICEEKDEVYNVRIEAGCSFVNKHVASSPFPELQIDVCENCVSKMKKYIKEMGERNVKNKDE